MTRPYYLIQLVCLFFFLFLHSDNRGDLLNISQEAWECYKQGEKADTVAKRREYFNKALALYTSLENPQSSGKLYLDIGNTYFQLEEYGFAILYYYKAQKSLPRNDKIMNNLKVAEKKAGLVAQDADSSVLHQVLFFHFLISDLEKLKILYSLLGMILALLSAYIWKEKIVFKQLAFLCIILFTIILTSVLFNRNIRPIEAIVVRPSLVYCDRGKEFAHVSEDPMRTGSKVEVIEMTDDANWMKISTQEGIKGYIPADCIRII